MARPPKNASRRYHDRVARQYDAIYDTGYWDFHDQLTWRLIKPYLPRNALAECCDLGCGTGKWGMKLLKSGYRVTFVDNSAAMIEQSRIHIAEAGQGRMDRATLFVADMVEMPAIASESFQFILAMGDPLSICSDAQRAVREMHRICQNDAIVIATADNKLAALDHFVQKGDLEALEEFVKNGRTNWLTADEREQFELTTFTPLELQRLFEKGGFEVVSITGKPIIPVRSNTRLLTGNDALERLLRLEKILKNDPASAARAGHLQIVARKRSA